MMPVLGRQIVGERDAAAARHVAADADAIVRGRQHPVEAIGAARADVDVDGVAGDTAAVSGAVIAAADGA